MSHDLHSDPIAIFVSVPLARMADLPLLPAVVSAGVFLQAARAVAADPFSILLVVVVIASGFDWWYGRRAAKLRDDYKAALAQIGMHSKIGAVGIVCLIRWLEHLAGGMYQTGGIVATIIGVGLILEDISSIEEKRIQLGAKPIFLLSHALALFRALLEKLSPTIPSTPGGEK